MTLGRTCRWLGVIVFLCMLTGCWDKSELPELGYVMGVAFDKGGNGKVRMTSQIYKPAQTIGSGGSKTGEAYIVIESQERDVFQSARAIPSQLGRKAQFSHMRVIIISEQIAKEGNIGEVLDFFYRDHEPRLTASLVIAKGVAADYLRNKPLIEYTISQQIKQITNFSEMYSAKTIETSLLDLAIALRGEQGIAILPYLEQNETKHLHTEGGAILLSGRMKGLLTDDQMKTLLMLRNEFSKGIIDLKCGKELAESFEVSELRTARTITLDGNHQLRVHIRLHVLGSVGETRCSTLLTVADQKKYENKIKETLHAEFNKLVRVLQTKKLDALGLGDQMHRDRPGTWSKVKQEWPELFAHASFSYSTNVIIQSTGTESGKPLIQKTE